MAVSKRLRYEILRRDNHACRYCGATAPDAKLVVDHVTPTALGGTDAPDNLVTACEPCNSGKSSMPADATVVAGVANDAVRWALAMKQAAAELEAQAKPKDEYRAAFKTAWDEWTHPSGNQRKTFDLDPEWRTSLERFRQVGLPATAWPDIVERAMTNKTVKADNLFRYCCGIAWRMVTELQERAKAIVGAAGTGAEDEDGDVIVEAALEVWVSEWPGTISGEQGDAFAASVKQIRETGTEEAHRILQGAQFAAWFHQVDIGQAIAALDRDEVTGGWSTAWFAASAEFPDDSMAEAVKAQCNSLLDAGVYVGRVLAAAVYAGARRSANLHFGLSEAELAHTKISSGLARAMEIWTAEFSASSDRWPTPEERTAFIDSALHVGDDGGFLICDLNAAAAAAGAYQDSDLSTCLARHRSVFEAAALPLQKGSA